jgi:hypothetical protein
MVPTKYNSATRGGGGDFLHPNLIIYGARESLDEFKNAKALESDYMKGKGLEEQKKWEAPLVFKK